MLTYPLGYDAAKKYPLVLGIHGGPVATSTWDFGTIEGGAGQILAAHGFLVLAAELPRQRQPGRRVSVRDRPARHQRARRATTWPASKR